MRPVSLVIVYVFIFSLCWTVGGADEKGAAGGSKDAAAFQGKTLAEWKEQLNDKSEFVRLSAAVALGECGPKAVPTLVGALNHQDATVRYWAAKGLGKAGPDAKSAIPGLIKAPNDPCESVQVVAANALWRLGEKTKGMAGLIEGTKAQSAGARLAAVNNLCLIGADAKEALPAVKEAAEVKSDDYVQDYVVRKANFFQKLLGAKQSLEE